ncbi:hypothetical protein EGJ27_07965 [Pseudomonas sp. v388]|uniref:hypothetical protein n=1 Tax=Pseudomonas sp. v388 TaxID=2479849 RepID=UPI000F7B8D1C|nr:hypothetical protein [Pseudomonas sp. v388]RRV07994.1 hypothetical protein EGJ27_07965 [Pseudomonas sp. v388]
MQEKIQPLVFPAPSLPQLNEDGTLSIASIRGGVEVTIPVYPGMKAGDQVTVPWEGTPAHPEIGFAAIHTVTSDIEPRTYLIPSLDVHDKWKKLKVWYYIKNVGESEAVTVDVVA